MYHCDSVAVQQCAMYYVLCVNGVGGGGVSNPQILLFIKVESNEAAHIKSRFEFFRVLNF